MRVREALTFTQTYTASVASVLPVLLSAIRVSPLSEGPAHDGKIIGKDVVNYVYKQVWVILIFVSQD
jgi:leukotriene-A4 hydrolase